MSGPAAQCPICGSAACRALWRGREDAIAAEDVRISDSSYGRALPFVQCRECGHAFSWPAPDSEELVGAYRGMSDDLYAEEAACREQALMRAFQLATRDLEAPGRMLDVGAATGILTRAARAEGWEVVGVEPSAWAVREARERHGTELFEGTLAELPGDQRDLDVVTLIDVIEHVPDPRALLRQARARLRPGGRVLVVTPDVTSLPARLMGRRWWHVRTAHVCLFSRRSLLVLLEQEGFEVTDVRRYAWTFSLEYWVSRLERLTAVRWLLGALRATRPGRALLRRPLSIDFRDSLAVVAQRGEAPA